MFDHATRFRRPTIPGTDFEDPAVRAEWERYEFLNRRARTVYQIEHDYEARALLVAGVSWAQKRQYTWLTG